MRRATARITHLCAHRARIALILRVKKKTQRGKTHSRNGIKSRWKIVMSTRTYWQHTAAAPLRCTHGAQNKMSGEAICAWRA